MATAYADLIARKRVAFEPRGFRVPALNSSLKPHQEHATAFALEQGCSAMFLDTGLGKSFAALEWGRCVVEHTNKPVLMLAPLAVGPQHAGEAERWGIDARYIREPEEIRRPGNYITNYDRLHRFDTDQFGGAVLDESGILKSFNGKTTRNLIDRFARTPYRLACTATPAPNDHTELATHAEFLGVMRREDMLTRWFIHDSADTGEWRLKRPAAADFWAWMTTWSRAISKPSDLGFSDEGYILPPLHVVRHLVDADLQKDTGGALFRSPEQSATSIHREKRLTVAARADKIAEVTLGEAHEPRVIWCDTDYEADALTDRIPSAVEVRGSQRIEEKEEKLIAFASGQTKHLVTKERIAGWGLNWQHCARMARVGLSYSYESYYQGIRRCWRFGQTREVSVDIAMAETEAPILAAIDRKAASNDEMRRLMVAAMSAAVAPQAWSGAYVPAHNATIPNWL
jgi:hypothetical protein